MAVLPIGTVTTPFVPATSSISGISGISGVSGSSGTAGTSAVTPSFGDMLARGIESVTSAQDTASTLGGQLATGELTDISEFTTAAAKASLGVSLTANVRNRAVEAYQEIMRMQV